MPVRLSFALTGALRLAEHATTAPTNLRRPGTPLANTPALRLVIEDRPGQPAVVYLLSCGVPCLAKPNGAPMALYADETPLQVHRWPTDPHEAIDLNRLVPSGAITGRPMPVARVWYMPLHRPGERPLTQLMRAALLAGYTHLSIDAASLTTAVAKRRHRRPQPCEGPPPDPPDQGRPPVSNHEKEKPHART